MERKVISDRMIIREITVGILAALLILGGGTAWAAKDAGKIRLKKNDSAQQDPEQQANEPDPFSDLIRIQREMNRLFSSTLNPYSAFPSFDYAFSQETVQPVDIRERPGAFVVQMDLPGMDKTNIAIEVKDRILTVSGERKESVEKREDETYLLQERTSNMFSREVVLPRSVAADAVEAVYKDGVLTITLPKTEENQAAHKIKIK
jgi:HSP20 family protein